MRKFLVIVVFLSWSSIPAISQESASGGATDNEFVGRPAPVENAIRGFVGVEPFEVRLEALVQLEAYRDAWRIQGNEIGRGERDAILENLTTLFESGATLTSPDSPITFSDRLVRFVRRDAEKGFVEDDRESIPVSDALVGMTLFSDATGVRELEIEWLWFAPRQDRVVIEIASRGSPAARYVTPEKNTVSWELDQDLEQPELLQVPEVVSVRTKPLRYLIIVGIALWVWGAVVVMRSKERSTSLVGWIFVAGLACGIVAVNYKTTRFERPDDETIEEIVYNLLRNTYHAFDFRDESAIYDTLEKSVTGPLLEKVYLEIRSSLELENTGGPRVRVYEVALREAEPMREGIDDSKKFGARAEWVTIGEVTHWGHTHERTNKYEAELTVMGRGEEWKISGLDLLNEERVQKISRRVADRPATAEPEE